MIAKGSVVFWKGKHGQVLQLSPQGRAIVRLSSGEARPINVKELYEDENAAPLASVAVSQDVIPEGDPELRELVTDLRAWTPADGFGFHRLFKRALEVEVVEPPHIEKAYNVTYSTIRNWGEGVQRPPMNVQKEVIETLIDKTIYRMENPPEEEELPSPPPVEDTASTPSDLSLEPPERRSVETGGYSFTLSVYPSSEGQWLGVVEELPIEASGASKVEVVMDLKSLIHNHLLKHSNTPVAVAADPAGAVDLSDPISAPLIDPS